MPMGNEVVDSVRTPYGPGGIIAPVPDAETPPAVVPEPLGPNGITNRLGPPTAGLLETFDHLAIPK